jgi:osmoprotectant transport system ATP-binding protein
MSAFVEFDGASVDVPGAGTILSDLTLAIEEGKTLALIGRSGSGKTTALRLANALVLPTRGRVRVAGRETTSWNPIELRRRTGYVIQEVGLFPHLSVAENVGLVPELEGWPQSRIDERTRELLDLVGLPEKDYASRRPHHLSGGQRQRVGVARALAADPPLVLLDEPFGALDPLTRRELQREFRALTLRLGKTAIFVTHDLAEAALVADHIALLSSGRLLAFGTLDELMRSPQSELQAFLDAGNLDRRSRYGDALREGGGHAPVAPAAPQEE